MAFISNYLLRNMGEEPWRWMLGVEGIPAVAYFSKFLKTVFLALSWVKIPFPAVEFTTNGQVNFHPIMF